MSYASKNLVVFDYRPVSKLSLWLATALAAAVYCPSAMAAEPLVEHHRLDCSIEFQCPEQIKRRVDFWVQVFGQWDKHQAILHDANAPWRTFEVISGVKSCSKSAVKNKRKRLKANLERLAQTLEADQAPRGSVQQKLAAQFDTLSSETVLAAADNLRCQLGVKDQFSSALARFHRYAPMTSRIIAQAGLPKDLVYLPFVESSYRPDAYSKAGAAGMWQIMPNTARSLGMELNAAMDERLDPEAATRAAMRYFTQSNKRLTEVARLTEPDIRAAQINPFMVTSYNYGVNGMRRAIKQLGPDFYKVLDNYKSAGFQVAVKNFYASFLAARHLAQNVEAYFPKIRPLKPIAYQTLVINDAVSVARILHQFKLRERELKPLNPALTRFIWNNWRLIPAGYRLRLPVDAGQWEAQIASLRALEPEAQPVNKTVYRVRRGDTACAIAMAFKVSCNALIRANDLGKKGVIRLGQRLDIPSRLNAVTTRLAGLSAGPSGRYTVKRGDSACKIAQRLDASCKELIRLNKLGRKAKIVAGQSLRIPGLEPAVVGDAAKSLARATHYTVRAGDTLCQIAQRFDLRCASLSKLNRLSSRGLIRVGQRLKLPQGGGASAPISTAPDQLPWADTLDNLGDVAIRYRGGVARIRVLPDETIGHYSDWLKITSSSHIRRANNMTPRAVLPLGRWIKLPKISAQQKRHFESKRSEYHQVLSEQFKARFKLVGQQTVKVRSGQSLWDIATAQNVPLWIILRFNPSLLGTTLQVGQAITVPSIQAI